jgi:ATP synthase protein I
LSRKGPKWAGSARRIGDAYMIATVLPLAVLLGYGAGWGLDRVLGSAPWCTVVFTAIGIAAGLREAIRIALRVGREEDEAARPPDQGSGVRGPGSGNGETGSGDRGPGSGEEPPGGRHGIDGR